MLPRKLGMAALLALATTGSAAAQSDTVFVGMNGPLASFLVMKDGAFTARGTFAQGALPASDGGTRLVWYTAQAAFRAGRVTAQQWNANNIGAYSAAFGFDNIASASGAFAAGTGNDVDGPYATALGAGNTVTGHTALAAGVNNSATGYNGIVLGYGSTASGTYSLALGTLASTANHSGAIVLSDASSNTVVQALADDQLMVRAAGGTIIYSSSAGAQNTWTGVRLNAGAGAWSALSDRRRKTEFLPVDGEQLLQRLRALPMTTWRYRTQPASVRHLGPTAQDFRAAFGLGEDEVTISTVDADGVALAAAQALEARTTALAEENRLLRAELAELRSMVEALRSRRP